MHILVIGGTGFLGKHIVNELLLHRHCVSVLSRTPEKARTQLPAEVNILQGDVDHFTAADYLPLLAGMDGLVFAAGTDERVRPTGDAYDFFYQANVAPCEQLLTAVRDSNIQRVVLLNSIFAWMDRNFPELKLATHHPYIRSRVTQSAVAHALAKDAFVLTVLEIPWVFGPSHREQSLWAGLINYVRGAVPLLATRGGANMMSVHSVAQAVHGALIYPEISSSLPIGDTNMTWSELLQHLCDCTGKRDRKVSLLPETFFRDITRVGSVVHDLLGIESGLATAHLESVLMTEAFFDPAPSQALLRYDTGNVLEAMQETVDTTLENTYLRNWRKYLNFFSPRKRPKTTR